MVSVSALTVRTFQCDQEAHLTTYLELSVLRGYIKIASEIERP